MIKFILKQFLYGQFYMWLKPKIYGLVFVLIGILSILYLHNEYLNYLEIKKDSYLVGFSFILKNFFIGVFVIGYLLYQHKLDRAEKEIATIEKKDKNDKYSISKLEYFLSEEELNK